MKFILDTNIYDKLATNLDIQAEIKDLIDNGFLKIIVTRTVAEKTLKSPFQGIPKFFPIEYKGNTVSRSGLMCAGDSLGSGEVFNKHKGESKKTKDALIADASDLNADYLVSEDNRLKRRMSKASNNCETLSYTDFIAKLKTLR